MDVQAFVPAVRFPSSHCYQEEGLTSLLVPAPLLILLPNPEEITYEDTDGLLVVSNNNDAGP